MSYRKHLMTRDEPPSELYKATEVGTDCISREQAIEALSELATFTDEWSEHTWMYTDDVYGAIKQLPPIQPVNCSEFPNNSDAISRQAAIDALRGYLVGKRCPDDGTLTCRLIENEVINKLPPAEPKKGKWIKSGRWGRVYKCNQCGNYLDFDGVNVGRGSTNFCPNCGAKMEVTT